MDAIISKNYDDCEIGTVCQRNGGQINPTCFQSLGELTDCLHNFYNMSHTYSTTVFRKKWASQLSDAFKENPELSFNDVYSSVWLSCFDHFQTLLEKLMSLNIMLADVDEHFSDCKDSLDTVLLNLYKGVNHYNAQDESWIGVAVEKCKKYWRLCQNCDVAKLILRLRDFLRLTGDFSLVEKLSQEVLNS